MEGADPARKLAWSSRCGDQRGRPAGTGASQPQVFVPLCPSCGSHRHDVQLTEVARLAKQMPGF